MWRRGMNRLATAMEDIGKPRSGILEAVFNEETSDEPPGNNHAKVLRSPTRQF